MSDPDLRQAETLLASRTLRLRAESATASLVAPGDGRAARPARGAADEHLDDLLRPDEVARCFAAARDAEAGPAGEPQRRALRLRAELFLAGAVREQQAELAACAATLPRPAGGFGEALAVEQDPTERRRLHERWAEREARLEELRIERTRAAREAAVGCGADSLAGFRGATHPGAIDAWCERVETGAVGPLDEAIERASRDRRLRTAGLSEPEHPADGPWLRCLASHGPRFGREAVPAVLRVVGGAVGSDPDAGGPGLRAEAEARLITEPWIVPEGPAVLLGRLEGPAALSGALDAFGRAARACFLNELAGPAAIVGADPAFETAAGLLFRRLVLSPAFRSRFGPGPDEGLDADLRLEAALAPRAAWTYVYLARRRRSNEASPVDGEARRALRRALGRPAAVDEVRDVLVADPRDAAGLRGTVLALLLEERLMSRWGRGWFLEPRVGAFLREVWEAETGQTAEGVADGLDLGTIEPTPILDGCRP